MGVLSVRTRAAATGDLTGARIHLAASDGKFLCARRRLRPAQRARRPRLPHHRRVHGRAAGGAGRVDRRQGLRVPPGRRQHRDRGRRDDRADGRPRAAGGHGGGRLVQRLDPRARQLRRQPAQLAREPDHDVGGGGPGPRPPPGRQQGQPHSGLPALRAGRRRALGVHPRAPGGRGAGVPAAVLRPRLHVPHARPPDLALHDGLRGKRPSRACTPATPTCSGRRRRRGPSSATCMPSPGRTTPSTATSAARRGSSSMRRSGRRTRWNGRTRRDPASSRSTRCGTTGCASPPPGARTRSATCNARSWWGPCAPTSTPGTGASASTPGSRACGRGARSSRRDPCSS